MRDFETVLIAGDTHGSIPQLDYLADMAHEFDCQAILQLGDYGYWEHAPDGGEFLDGHAEIIKNSGLPFYWLGGNHDHEEFLLDNHSPGPDGTYEIRPNLFYLPRGYSWEWGGKRWLSLGGGNSIDKAWRGRKERELGFALWWESEAITDEDVQVCLAQPEVDIMVTHDAPGSIDVAWQFHRHGTKGLDVPRSFVENRDRIQTVVDHHEPELLFHGHLHIPYVDTPYEGAPKVVALANEGYGSNGLWAENKDSWTVWFR